MRAAFPGASVLLVALTQPRVGWSYITERYIDDIDGFEDLVGQMASLADGTIEE